MQAWDILYQALAGLTVLCFALFFYFHGRVALELFRLSSLWRIGPFVKIGPIDLWRQWPQLDPSLRMNWKRSLKAFIASVIVLAAVSVFGQYSGLLAITLLDGATAGEVFE